MSISVEQMVHREVVCCVSHLVSTLAGSYGALQDAGEPLIDLAEQAFELSCPIPDYEEAATQAGFKFYETTGKWHAVDQMEDPDESMIINFDDAEEVCREQDLEPYEREVYEHWAVSPWLAEKLIEQGERVDTDFANLGVWARTTTGQCIASDGVIERIHAAMIST